MKAAVNDLIKTLDDIRGDYSKQIIIKGSLGTVVECYEDPESYAVDLAIPDETLAGGFSYENVILFPHQFEVVRHLA